MLCQRISSTKLGNPEWDVSATPIRRRRFGDGRFGDENLTNWTIRRYDDPATRLFGDRNIGRFVDRVLELESIDQMNRRWDISATLWRRCLSFMRNDWLERQTISFDHFDHIFEWHFTLNISIIQPLNSLGGAPLPLYISRGHVAI